MFFFAMIFVLVPESAYDFVNAVAMVGRMNKSEWSETWLRAIGSGR